MTIEKRYYLASAILVTVTMLLGWGVTHNWFHKFDLLMSNHAILVRGQSSNWVIMIMQAISWTGGGVQRYVFVALISAALWKWSGWRAAAAMVAGALSSSITSDLLKIYFARLRPDIFPHLDHAGSAAFPSGHTTNAAMVYLLLILILPRGKFTGWKVGLSSLILLTGISRLTLGMHWSSDIVGGWMLGAAFAMTCYAGFMKTPHETAPKPVLV